MKTRHSHYQNISPKESAQLISKAIQACLNFSEQKISMNQLWYRFRGHRINLAIQRCPDLALNPLLFKVYLDFLSWKDERNDLIADSALAVANYMIELNHEGQTLSRH